MQRIAVLQVFGTWLEVITEIIVQLQQISNLLNVTYISDFIHSVWKTNK